MVVNLTPTFFLLVIVCSHVFPCVRVFDVCRDLPVDGDLPPNVVPVAMLHWQAENVKRLEQIKFI